MLFAALALVIIGTSMYLTRDITYTTFSDSFDYDYR